MVNYVGMKERDMAVLSMRAVLVFHGWMKMIRRCNKHSGQERYAEQCHTGSSQKHGS